ELPDQPAAGAEDRRDTQHCQDCRIEPKHAESFTRATQSVRAAGREFAVFSLQAQSRSGAGAAATRNVASSPTFMPKKSCRAGWREFARRAGCRGVGK